MTAAAMFEQTWRETVARLGDQDPDRRVQIRAVGAMRLADWTLTRVTSVAAHGLDVALTLGRVPWTTSTALMVMRGVFVSLLGAEPPPRLAWDNQTLLEVGTGRRAQPPQLVGAENLIHGVDLRFPVADLRAGCCLRQSVVAALRVGAQRSVPFAVHSGEAVERDGDFYGPAVNRARGEPPGRVRSASVRCGSSCQIHHWYGGVWG